MLKEGWTEYILDKTVNKQNEAMYQYKKREVNLNAASDVTTETSS